jgi:uncharacterized protein YndB with AHSA1/START domain
MTSLPHQLDRTITIAAPPAVVFRYFTDSARWAAWWGAGSTIDPRPGGAMRIRYPNGIEVSGEVVSVREPESIVFTYGYASGQPMGPGASRVAISLEHAGRSGTRLHLRHEFADAAVRDHHVQGWRYQLAVFANVVSNELHADAAAAVDGWFALWADPDAASRERTLAALADSAITFRDRYSCLDGKDDVLPHIAASQHFMPGVRLVRDGDVRHCQGLVLANWIARGPEGTEVARGTNLFTFGPDRRIEAVTGFNG